MSCPSQILVSMGSATPFNPESAGTLRGWWKGDAITGLNHLDLVSTWVQSAAAGVPNMAQTTTALKPVYRTDGPNGKPFVRFDGVDDKLTAGSGGFGDIAIVTAFIVAKSVDFQTDTVISLKSGSSAPGLFKNTTTDDYRLRDGSQTDVIMGSVSTSAFVVRSAVSAGIGTGWSTNSGTILGGWSLAGNQWAGDLAETLIYAGTLSGASIADVTAYLQAKYAL